jgi:transmembrane sensor
MSSDSRKTPDIEKREREATTWFVRLNESDVADDERREFRRWLAEDPAHHQAFNDVKNLWTKLDAPAAILGEGGWHREGLREPRPLPARGGTIAAALAACLVIAIGGLIWRDPGFLDRVRADHATRPGERRNVSLADGSQVYLDGDTAITVKFGANGRSIELLRGRAWFDVVHNLQTPFSVRSGEVETRVIGTAFAVDREPADVGVTVERGLVAVSRLDAERVQVPAGKQVWVGGGRIGQVVEADAETTLAWRRGLIILDQAPLGRVIDELARMQPGRVMMTDNSLRQLRLTGVFKADDPDAIVEALRSALGLRTLTVPGFATFVFR